MLFEGGDEKGFLGMGGIGGGWTCINVFSSSYALIILEAL